MNYATTLTGRKKKTIELDRKITGRTHDLFRLFMAGSIDGRAGVGTNTCFAKHQSGYLGFVHN
jgi:hypothetical protein